MSNNTEKQDGLSEIYLNPSCHPGQGHGVHTSSDTETNVWEDTDSEVWTPLIPELTLGSAFGTASVLGLREEIEGGSSFDVPLNRTPQKNEIDSISEGAHNAEALVIQLDEFENTTVLGGSRGQVPWQRGETPGSDCPPEASITAFVRRLGQPLNLDTKTQTSRTSELIFSPGGDQGFIVPQGVHAYYGSGSDTETLEWVDRGGGPTLVPVRDAVEGADAGPSPDQAMETSVEGLERNSPAGLSTPDAEIDLTVTTGGRLVSKEPQEAIRPPAVGQSKEVLMQSFRKDLGSTDGEESEDENRKRIPQEAITGVSGSAETQLGSLGSQSENTDSVSTVLDMRRGEVQGCEGDCASNTTTASPTLGGEIALTQPKPAFVVGGLISPRGKLRQFQDTVRDRMQNVKASLELRSGSADEPVIHQNYLSQLPLYPSLISTNEPEVSLASLVSVESTNPPESSDRVTSPSVLSVSSVASSKRMEWDSGADVGYLGTNTHVTPAASLSTLERIALGSYASVLRTEPEGTTQAKEKQVSKKGGKLVNTKGGNQGAIRKNSTAELSIPFPLCSIRIHQNREKVYLSSSEEDLYNKLPSPTQSPRRRLRRRALITSPGDGDVSAQRSTRAMHFLDRRLREITQERHSEGKSSSLVELTTPAISSCQYRRSNSQQSLHVALSQARSAVIVAAERDATRGGAIIMKNKKGEQLVANTSTSTSTLVQSMSPLPVVGTVASTSTSTAMPGAFQNVLGGKEGHVSVAGDSWCSSMSSLPTQDREFPQHQHGKPSWTSSGNDISSRSEASSPMWLPSHTDTESLASHPIFTAEPNDLKARKNSENAKNHDNIARRGSSSDLEGKGIKVDSTSSSPGHIKDPHTGALDTESTLENQVSLKSFNNALHALSLKLQEHIQTLLDNGSLRKVQDYNKLQDYVRFVGIPSVTEEECRLRQGVAGVITRMFGEIAFDHPQATTDTSNTFTSETSDSHAGDQCLHTPVGEKDEQEHGGKEKEQQDNRRRKNEPLCIKEQEQQGAGKEQDRAIVEQNCCTTPGGRVVVVPYRPPSSSRTYFMAVSHEWEAGLVEGEHVLTTNDMSVSRGQAEGERLEGAGAVPITPRLQDTPSESVSNNDWDSAKVVSAEGTTKQEGDEEAHPCLPSDHQFLERRQGTGTPQSELSEGQSCSPLLHTWPREEPTSINWWVESGRCGRLYQDRQGGLHVANQPPGYTDDHDDSHPSESFSDHDHCIHRHSGDAGRPSAHPWTSSGSESAYETIRERHRHVDEALASSFEFYSTSPRDARLLGYISSEGQEEEEQQSNESLIPTPSPADCDSVALSDTLRHPWQPRKQQRYHQQHEQWQHKHQQEEHQQQKQLQQIESQNSSSSHTDAHDVSRQISIIQHQKQKYVKKIQRHIQTLKKLERALLDQLEDSIGSEGTFRQRVVEGHSQIGSITSGNARTHNVIDHSDTTSSIKSNEENMGAVKKQRNMTHISGVNLKSHPSGKESPLSNNGNREDITLAFGPSETGHSYLSSPRISISEQSSDIASSRASTMRQVEEEVEKLAAAEEQSRKIVMRPHSSSYCWGSHIPHRRSQPGKEPEREEGPVQSRFIIQSVESNTPESIASDGRMLSTANKVPATRRVPPDSSSSELQSVQTLPISEKSSCDKLALESQKVRQGEGRKPNDKIQIGKVGIVTAENGKALLFRSPSAAGVNISELPSLHSNTVLFRDFGQMFPSSECIMVDGGGKGESVGVQNSNSLSYSGKGCKIGNGNMSISTSDRESTAGSVRNEKAQNKGKQATGSNEDANYAKKYTGRKSCHQGTKYMRKSSLNRKDFQEDTPKLDEVNKEKEPVKEWSKRKELESNSIVKMGNNNKKIVHRSSSRVIVKNKYLPLKDLKMVPKSGRKGTTGSKNRAAVYNDKCDDSQDHELSSRSTSESEDRIISNGSSSSHSVRSISHISLENDRMSLSKLESIENKGRHSQYSESDNFAECSKEIEHYSPDAPNSVNEDSTTQGHQSPSRKQCITSDDQSNLEESVQDLKGRAKDSLNLKSPVQLRSSENQNVISKHMSTSASNSFAKHKLTNNTMPLQTKRENLKNKSNLVQHCLQEERHSIVIIHGSDSQQQEQQSKSGMLKVALMENKEKGYILERKPPVHFEVKFSNEENFNPKPQFSAATTSAVLQEEFTHSTKGITLQDALARARPDYLRDADDRSALIRLKREMRQAAQTHNHNVLAQIPPNLQTPSTLQRFMYKPDLAPLFSYKDIRLQNQRLYSLLPEAMAPGAKQHHAAVLRTNRLLASLYSQRLRKKVMQGRVSHAHKEVVTPLVHRVLHK